jgi:hypothetical protein
MIFNQERATQLADDADYSDTAKSIALALAIGIIIAIAILTGVPRAQAQERVVIGGRPAGCPHAYCGCALRNFLGLSDKRLDRAWEWARLFRHGSAGPGMAAVRHHHVMLLVSHVEGTIWTVRDYNGGRHLSYIHDRSVSGRIYVFVDPSSRVAMR